MPLRQGLACRGDLVCGLPSLFSGPVQEVPRPGTDQVGRSNGKKPTCRCHEEAYGRTENRIAHMMFQSDLVMALRSFPINNIPAILPSAPASAASKAVL